MKQFKHLKKVFLLTTVVFAMGCSEEFLQDEKNDGISDELVFSSPRTTKAAVTGVYDVFQGSPTEYLTKGIYYPANYLTQDWLNIGADVFFQTFEIPTTFGPFNQMWIQNYAGIGRANSALVNLEPAIANGVVSDSLGSRLTAESYTLRGILYTLLASNFGGVPLVLEPAGGNADSFAPRNTQEEVFRQVVTDMQKGVESLPWEYDEANEGRVTKGAAYAYMGNAYMWLGEYQKAIDAYEKLESHYSLEENYLDIHAYDNRNGKESIFEIQMSDETGELTFNHNDNVTFLQSFNMPWEISGGGGYSAPTEVLYESFEEGDERKLATLLGPGDENPDPLIDISDYPYVQENYGGINTVGTEENPWLGEDGLPGRQGYYAEKTWRNPNVEGWSSSKIFGDQNLIFLRYGQVLLSLAESYHKIGNDAMAMQYVMRIRNRADLTEEPNGDVMRIIMNEYRHELSGEFSLWWVYRRSGNAATYLSDKFGVSIPQGHELMPIPQQQIDTNPNLTQNPGY